MRSPRPPSRARARRRRGRRGPLSNRHKIPERSTRERSPFLRGGTVYLRARKERPRLRSRGLYLCLSLALGLPNLAALLRGANHRVADLALEGFGELGHVRERPVDAEARERVRVTLHLQARGLGRVLLGPDLRPAEEEALLGRGAVDVG